MDQPHARLAKLLQHDGRPAADRLCLALGVGQLGPRLLQGLLFLGAGRLVVAHLLEGPAPLEVLDGVVDEVAAPPQLRLPVGGPVHRDVVHRLAALEFDLVETAARLVRIGGERRLHEGEGVERLDVGLRGHGVRGGGRGQR